MAKFKDLGDNLEIKLKKISNFKIGKTNQNIENTYVKNYIDLYSNYYQIGASTDLDVILRFESYLIERFKHFNNCDNSQIIKNEIASSNEYIVYLMYNDK